MHFHKITETKIVSQNRRAVATLLCCRLSSSRFVLHTINGMNEEKKHEKLIIKTDTFVGVIRCREYLLRHICIIHSWTHCVITSMSATYALIRWDIFLLLFYEMGPKGFNCSKNLIKSRRVHFGNWLNQWHYCNAWERKRVHMSTTTTLCIAQSAWNGVGKSVALLNRFCVTNNA